MALAAGLASWTYRYAATHRSTQFWGHEAALLIARPSKIEFLRLELADSVEDFGEGSGEVPLQSFDLGRLYLATQVKEITQKRGMVHFRHALMSDGNYEWASRPDPSKINWRWAMRFHDGQMESLLVLAEDLATIGLVASGESPQLKTLSCQPMAETLKDYFRNVGLTTASKPQ